MGSSTKNPSILVYHSRGFSVYKLSGAWRLVACLLLSPVEHLTAGAKPCCPQVVREFSQRTKPPCSWGDVPLLCWMTPEATPRKLLEDGENTGETMLFHPVLSPHRRKHLQGEGCSRIVRVRARLCWDILRQSFNPSWQFFKSPIDWWMISL